MQCEWGMIRVVRALSPLVPELKSSEKRRQKMELVPEDGVGPSVSVLLLLSDQMLAVGFEEAVKSILENLPQKRQSMLFS
ncbi:hypothetical protein YC2023_052437 [Brassica napus]